MFKFQQRTFQYLRLGLNSGKSHHVHSEGYCCPKILCQDTKRHQKSLVKLSLQSFCTDATDINEISIDKRMYGLLDKWEMENAVSLVINAVHSGNTSLSGHAIIHLLGQLGEIGDIENLLIIEPHLKDSHLISLDSYYYYLSQALCNAGRMDQGALYLKQVMTGDYDRDDSNVLFTLLTVPTLLDFTDYFQLYIDIVNEQASLHDFYPVALLWKCYILCGEFQRADDLLQNYESEIKSFVPVMMNEICQLKDKVVTRTSHEEMLFHLLNSPHLRKKKLRSLVYRTLLQTLYSDSRWFDLQTALMDAKDSQVQLPRDFIQHHVNALKSIQTHQDVGLDMTLLNELDHWAKTPNID